MWSEKIAGMISVFLNLLRLVFGLHDLTWKMFCVCSRRMCVLLVLNGIPFMYLLFSHSVVSSCLWPHGLQHARLSCPWLSPGVCSNSWPLSQWCHPVISSSVELLASCLQSSQRASPGCSLRGLHFVAVCGCSCSGAQALGTEASELQHTGSVVGAHGPRASRFKWLRLTTLERGGLSSCGAEAQPLCSMWNPLRPGIKSKSPPLAGGFLPTALLGGS